VRKSLHEGDSNWYPAKNTGLSRTTLYKTLSENGNPEWATLEAILAVYGIRIGFLPIRAGR